MTKAQALVRLHFLLNEPGEIDLDEVPFPELMAAIGKLPGPILATLTGRIEWVKREGFIAGRKVSGKRTADLVYRYSLAAARKAKR